MTRCRRIVGSLDGGGWKSPMAEFLLRGDLELSIFTQNLNDFRKNPKSENATNYPRHKKAG